jgi:glutathione synthase/RimK-type ligase-like ATP-grasp enzyme
VGGADSLILIVSNARDVTADFFERALAAAGRCFLRLNTEALAEMPLTLTFGTGVEPKRRANVNGSRLDLDQIDGIYYRRPVPPQVPGDGTPATKAWVASELQRTWGGFLAGRGDIRWINHPLTVSSASYKPEQLARAERYGLRVPETLITSVPAEALAFCERHAYDLVVKPVGHGEIRGTVTEQDRVVYTSAITPACRRLLERVEACPTLVQQRIAKAVDLRITVVEDECIAVALHSQDQELSAVDCRRDNMRGMRYSLTQLPAAVERTLAAFVQSYGLFYAAVDMVLDTEGEYWFLEVNPAGQWAWLEERAGAPISQALIRCFTRRHDFRSVPPPSPALVANVGPGRPEVP